MVYAIESRISARLPPTVCWMLMAVAISSRSSDRTRRTMFPIPRSNGRPRLTSRMTRLNSVEIGGRDSRTTSSTAWRNDDPARRPLASSVIVSGSCLLNAPRRPALRRLSQKRGSRKPRNAPTMRASGLRSAGSASDATMNRNGSPKIAPIQIARNSDGLSFRSARAMSRARFAPKSRCSTTLLSWARATLWASRSEMPPALLASVLPLWRAEAYRSRRALTPELLPDAAMPIAIRKIAAAATAATARVMGFTARSPPRSVAEAEEARRQMDAHHLELLDELRSDAGRLEAALDLAFDDTGLLEDEDVLHDDDVAFHPLDLGDVDDLPGAVLQAGLLDDQVDGRGDLLADGADRKVDAGHEDHRLEAGEHVAGAVGVTGRHRAVVTGVHCLEHVQRLTGAALSDDDPVGPHPEGVPDELADRDGALAFDVRRAGLEGDDVLLAELELGRVLDRDDPLVVRDKRGEDVQRRRLAGAGAAGDEDVQAGLHAGAEEVEHVRSRGAEPDEVVDGERRRRELPDRDHGPDERQRRDDRVDAGAVGQAGVDHWRGLVHAATDRRDDPVDDPHDVVVVLEDDVRQLELARSLDVDLARAVDHDLRDRLVAEEGLQGAEADDLVGDLLEHPDALGAGQGEAFLVDDLAEDLLDLAPDLDLVRKVELRVQVLDDPALDPELDVAERLPDRRLGHQPARRRRRLTAGCARTGRNCRDPRPRRRGCPR